MTGGAGGPAAGPSLLVAFEFPPMRGGVARVLGELARCWPAGALVISTGDAPGAPAADAGLPVRVDRLPVPARRLRSLRGLLFWSRRVASLARELDPDFIWCGSLQPATYPAKWTRERVGVPYGILVHGADLLTLQHRLHQSRVRRRTLRSLLGSASVIVANSRWTRERCEVVLGELEIGPSPERIRVVPLASDPDRFRPGLETTPVRERYRLPDARWILSIAGPAPDDGVDVTLRALALLGDEFTDVHCLVVATGDHRAALEGLAGELGVGARVRLLTEVAAEDLPPLHNLAAVYVGVPRQAGLDVDGFGLGVLEASASGVPVVAGRSGGMPDVVRDGDTGILVDAENPEAVAAALRALLAGPARGRALGQGGRRAVETYFNWGRVVADLRGISAAFQVERAPAPPP